MFNMLLCLCRIWVITFLSRHTVLFLLPLILPVCLILPFSARSEPASGLKPVFRDFMGICGHTVQFRPKLYSATCQLVRDYHGFGWDVGKDTHYWPQFPFARNRVDWDQVYGSWKEEGFDINVSIMFNNISMEQWTDLEKDAYTYGFAFARVFGPSFIRNLVTAAEIGNEPGHYDDATYRKLFMNMAQGMRTGDPGIKIVTCNATTEESGKYAKSLACFKGLEHLYDAISIHVYAFVENWPTWRRSFPEDPEIDYLKTVEKTIAWRNEYAKGKPIWITEFGWDSSTKEPPQEGTFAKWEGVSDTQQAQYLVRSFLVFSKMDVKRAYMYFFDDSDQPHVHGSSGLTRDFQPKPSFYAVSHLYRTLGEYRFKGAVVEKAGELFVYEFVHGEEPGQRILAVWSPTGSGQKGTTKIPLNGATLLSAERTPMTEDESPIVDIRAQDDNVLIHYDESPIFLMIKDNVAEL